MDEVDPVAGLNGMYAYLYKFDTMGYGDEAQHYDYGYHHILLCSDLWGQDMIQYSSKYGWYYTDYQFNQNSRAYQYISTFYFWNYLYKLIKSANDVLKTTTDDSKIWWTGFRYACFCLFDFGTDVSAYLCRS